MFVLSNFVDEETQHIMWKQAAALTCVVAVYQHAVSAFDDPQHAENITIYHVNSDSFGVAPLNMDVANLPGDAFFDLRSLVSVSCCWVGGSLNISTSTFALASLLSTQACAV